MTDTIKILGQVAPSAATVTTAYTVPGATKTIVSAISVCNTNAPGTGAQVRVGFAVNGAGDNVKQWIYYDFPLDGGSTLITPGVTLGAGDLVRVRSDVANVAFQVFGDELT